MADDQTQAIFDLKLIVSQQQEELSLYRNGTTAVDLMSMLEEKDAEIVKLKEHAAAKDAFLSKLGMSAKKSLSDLDSLKKEKKSMEAQISKSFDSGKQEVMKDLLAARKEISGLRAENLSLTNSIDLLIPETEHFQGHIDELETEAIHSSTDIEKLQDRCVNVVKENKEKKRALVDRANKAEEEVKKAHGKIDKYHQELVKAQDFNKSLKDRITKEKDSAVTYKERIAFLETQLKTIRPEKQHTTVASGKLNKGPFGEVDTNSTTGSLSAFATGESM